MTTRRDFVRALGIGGMTAGAGILPGCDREVARSGAAARGRIDPLTRPLLRAWSEDIIWISAPSGELPVAYVSMALRHVYVDHDFRDRAAWLLNAHISVSTAHWRIPLPGDPAGQPITPGDALREFEELSIREWDPAMRPAMDDVRIRRGRRAPRLVEFGCVPMAGGAWHGAGPWTAEVSDGGAEDTTREDFRLVGAGLRFADRECSADGEAVQYVMWACPDD